jgi:hypothetical protein
MHTWRILLFLGGLVLAGIPSALILKSPSVYDIRKERAYIAAWPAVTGKLDRVNIQQELRTARGYTWYFVEVEYRYIVDGREFTGNRLGINPRHYSDTSHAALEAQIYKSYLSPSHVIRREETDDGSMFRSKCISLYVANQVVRVFYDPKNPQFSLLDKTDYDPPLWWQDWVSAFPFVVIGIIIMTVSVTGRRESASVPGTKIFRPEQQTFPPQVREVPAANGRQQLYPESADWLDCQQMGQSLMRAGEKEKAIVLFERAYNIAPGELETRHTEIRILLDKAKCLIELGRNKEALQCLTEATSSSRGIDALFKEAVDLKEQLLSSTSCDHSSSVSPWLDKTSIASPNGKITAVIAGAQEIGMGAPTSGVLNISNGLRFEDCNPSMVWSADSEYIAVPQWTTGRRQRLMIVSVSHRLHRYAPGTYRVLRLESFENGIVTGIDSPIHLPKQIQVDIASIRWG